jgi:phosphate transport system protein
MPQRRRFQEELESLEFRVLEAFDLVVGMLDRTAEALDQQDAELAHLVLADDDVIDTRYAEVRDGVLSLVARQAPMAGDLRLVAALLNVVGHLERVGDQCVTICKQVPLEGGEGVGSIELLETLTHMARLARSQIAQAKIAFGGRNIELAEDLVRQDAKLNRLNREVFRQAIEFGVDAARREWAIHMMLVARALERVGDNAVDIGEQTAFLTTGLFREFTDASHPEVARAAAAHA